MTRQDPPHPQLAMPTIEKVDCRALLRLYESLMPDKEVGVQERIDHININEVGFTVYYRPQLAPGCLCVRCEVLELEDDRDLQLLPQQLTENLTRYHQQKAVFAVSADMRRVIALLNIALDNADVDTTESLLLDMAKDVREWRNRALSTSYSDLANLPSPGINTLFTGTQRMEPFNAAQ